MTPAAIAARATPGVVSASATTAAVAASAMSAVDAGGGIRLRTHGTRRAATAPARATRTAVTSMTAKASRAGVTATVGGGPIR
ncbi:hypothetical protein GCM10027067_01510 [Pseudactinotalea suaedae]